MVCLLSGTPKLNGLRSGGSADFQSAVSPNLIRQGVDLLALTLFRPLAGCKPAIRHSATLRYAPGLLTPPFDFKIRVKWNGRHCPARKSEGRFEPSNAGRSNLYGYLFLRLPANAAGKTSLSLFKLRLPQASCKN
jgi:hypothetical protein